MPSRTRGLWWKEWRQLRLLRLAGAALIVVAPLMLLSAAEAAKRGWVPLFAMQNYSAATVVQDALPMFLGFLIWPLFAMMFVAQSFCGDVATGTEWFWMTRPVRPQRVWRTRLVATLLSLIAIIALHWIVWRLLVTVWGNPDAFDAVGASTRWFLMDQFRVTAAGAALALGLCISVAAFLAALAASAFARSPMQTLALGLLLAALPLGLGQLLTTIFPHAQVGGFNLVSGLALLLFVVYVIVSRRSFCRGEPAGRGRLVRGLSVLGVGMAAIVVIAAPAGLWLTRHVEAAGLAESIVVSSPAGDRFFIYNRQQGSGWLYDVDSGDELAHLSPHVVGAAWNAEGDRLAVVRIEVARGFVLDLFDRDGATLVDRLACDRCDDVNWAGDRLAVSTFRDRTWGFDWIDTTSGERTPVDVESGRLPLHMVGPTRDGTTYIARQISVDGDSETTRHDDREGTLLLYALDPDTGRIAEPVTIEGIGRSYRFEGLAPDGSAVILDAWHLSAVVDFATASATKIGGNPAWLRPNRPVWARHDGPTLTIFVGEAGDNRELGQFEGHGHVQLSSSPDGRYLLLARYPNVNRERGVQALEHWLYDDQTQSWAELEQTKPTAIDGWRWMTEPAWVDNDTLVLREAGVLALCEPAVPGSLRYLRR